MNAVEPLTASERPESPAQHVVVHEQPQTTPLEGAVSA